MYGKLTLAPHSFLMETQRRCIIKVEKRCFLHIQSQGSSSLRSVFSFLTRAARVKTLDPYNQPLKREREELSRQQCIPLFLNRAPVFKTVWRSRQHFRCGEKRKTPLARSPLLIKHSSSSSYWVASPFSSSSSHSTMHAESCDLLHHTPNKTR